MKGFKTMRTVYEYSKSIKLDNIAGNYIKVPHAIICNEDMQKNRVTIFSYLLMCRGLNYKSNITINNIATWLGRVPSRNANGINLKISKTINQIKELNYIDFENEVSNTQLTKVDINMNKIIEDCRNSIYGIIYIDELEKIINYRATTKTGYQNVDVMLMVFAYLRMMITRRPNKLMETEIICREACTDAELIENRRKYNPDGYNDYFSNIAEELGINEREVSRAVTALKKIGLIYFESMNNFSSSGETRTGQTVFCNMYKREGSYLLEEGKEYYKREIENKISKCKAVWKNSNQKE